MTGSCNATDGIPAAYQHSVVTVTIGTDTFTLNVGTVSPARLPTPFGVITAMNPSRTVDDATNIRSMRALHALLHRRHITHTPAVSAATDGTYVEHGWCVTGIACHELTLIGRAFGQAAVYWCDDTVAVVACR